MTQDPFADRHKDQQHLCGFLGQTKVSALSVTGQAQLTRFLVDLLGQRNWQPPLRHVVCPIARGGLEEYGGAASAWCAPSLS